MLSAESVSGKYPVEAIAIVAGLPFGTPGATNLLRIAHIG